MGAGRCAPRGRGGAAAYTALVNLYPMQKITFDQLLAASLDSIPGSARNSQSIAVAELGEEGGTRDSGVAQPRRF